MRSVFGIRIRIQEAPEYGSNAYPDPQRIRIHSPALRVLWDSVLLRILNEDYNTNSLLGCSRYVFFYVLWSVVDCWF